MHEMAIMRGVFMQLQETIVTEKIDRPIEKVFFKAGKMNAVLPASLQFYFSVFQKENHLLCDAILEIEIIDIEVRCRSCCEQSKIEQPVFLCAHCGGAVQVIAGDQMWLDSIEVQD